jgi:hypothetical protein
MNTQVNNHCRSEMAQHGVRRDYNKKFIYTYATRNFFVIRSVAPFVLTDSLGTKQTASAPNWQPRYQTDSLGTKLAASFEV